MATLSRKTKEKSASREPDAELLRRLYRHMVFIRNLDTRCMNLQRQGRIGFYAPSFGQEACQVGSAAHIRKGDWIFPTYRDQGVALWAGYPLQKLVDQLFGNARDTCRGRQMPNHYSDGDTHVVSVSSPIATQLPHAVGAAYAMRYRASSSIAFAFLGDGGTSEGDFHAALNFAGVWKAPVVFFCANNQWAITVPREMQTKSETLAQKAEAYGFEGVQVDGNAVLDVYEAVGMAVEKARAGGGPTLIEALTYRMGPHSTSDDPRRYRDETEVEEWRHADPIERFQSVLASLGLWDDRLAAEAEEAARKAVNDAVERAAEVGPPPIETIFEDVYAAMPPFLQAQLGELRELPRQKGH